ncbi:MAG: serine (or cysteine) proteinase inhibitor, cladeB (ovalbumin), er [Planctomycetota bacterium]|nr:serine (or cysteine) proteinase inhibitor, cladeB (ovalbumin), er [Planctomycetota bacterium]
MLEIRRIVAVMIAMAVAPSALALAADPARMRTADPPASVADRNAFALALLSRLAPASEAGNVVVSPQGVSRVLAMAAEGASGETAAEIRRAGRLPASARSLDLIDPARPRSRLGLNVRAVPNDGYGLKVQEVPAGSPAAKAGLAPGDLILTVEDRPVRSLAALRDAVEAAGAGGRPVRTRIYAFGSGKVVEIAIQPEAVSTPSPYAARDAAFVQRGLAIRPEFRAALDRAFHAPLISLDFASDPRGAAGEIVRFATSAGDATPRPDVSAIDASTRLVLLDAVAFEAEWQHPFPPDSPAPFTGADGRRTEVPTLRRTGRYAMASSPDGSMLAEIPYVDDSFSFVLALPTEGKSPRALIASLSADAFDSRRRALKPRRVDLQLPRFGVASTHRLNAPLAAMGVTLAFSPRADFSNLVARQPGDALDRLALGSVVQSAYLKVTPRGTRAGAATTAAVVTLDAEAEPVAFHADRPFAFFLVDRRTGLIVFAGVLDDPARPD